MTAAPDEGGRDHERELAGEQDPPATQPIGGDAAHRGGHEHGEAEPQHDGAEVGVGLGEVPGQDAPQQELHLDAQEGEQTGPPQHPVVTVLQ
jgi:hypothetical protein